ncbi:hypothetical protein [Krasilnikovia sp. MM14-A1259]|uniref:hypothetical protein n=1 Tax=Krasilnikovia sp. MM14-A1259 TaxID=3373539 RepID=UPI00381ED8A2
MSLDIADAPAHLDPPPAAAPSVAAPPATTDPVGALAELRAGLDLAESVAARVAARPAYVADDDPPSRPPARHRRRWSLRDLPALADRLWRPPLGLAVALFASCGPAHALGNPEYVYYAVLVGLALSGLAVPLGLVGLRHRALGEQSYADQVAAHPVTAGPEPGDPAAAGPDEATPDMTGTAHVTAGSPA